MSPSLIEKIVREKVVDIVRNYEMDVTIEEIIVSGSRCRGLERDESDFDVVLSYFGRVREDTLFNILNEERMTIGGLEIDINPLNTENTGNLSDYLLGVEKYLSEKTGKTNVWNFICTLKQGGCQHVLIMGQLFVYTYRVTYI